MLTSTGDEPAPRDSLTCPKCGRAGVHLEQPCPGCGFVVSEGTTQLPVVAGSAGDGTTRQAPGGRSFLTLPTTPADATSLMTHAESTERRPPDGGPLKVGQRFGPRYLIVRLLGIGGMGAVYQAWDEELSVMVALKVVRPEVTRDPAAAREIERRFKQELVLARQVTHRNVVRIHDLGEIDGVKYITMSYIEGENLASVLRAGGPLPVARAMRIARRVAAGLQAAHDAGIVHRDLKPGNIMLEADDEAIIMDFGIARSAGPAAHPAVAAMPAGFPIGADDLTLAPLTMAGTSVGTLEYMAPEQARGEDVDQRVDIYAFGLTLYDMLLGRRRAERAGSAVADLQQRLERAPTPLKSLRPETPDPLNQFVARCVQPQAGDRFATTAEMTAALDRLNDDGRLRPVRRVIGLPVATFAALLLLGLSVAVWWYQRQQLPAPEHDPVSVVIADLENRTGDPAFDRTLEPTLRRALEDASFISAYDRSRVRALGVPEADQLGEVAARELAVKEGLGVVLSGSIAPAARGGYLVSVKATQTVTGAEIVQVEQRAAGKDQVLDVVTRLISRVRSALGDSTSESAQQFAMASLSATSLDVVRLYAKAQEAQSANRFEEARDSALQAVNLDPNFGIGYLVLAVASRNLGRLDDNERYLREALSHVDGMTERERLMTRGYSNWASGDYQQCVQEYGNLIARYPADVAGRNQLALCLSHLRNMRPAMEAVQEVVRILPSHPLFRVNLALYANYAGDFATAEQEARAVERPDAYAGLALAFAQVGQGRLDAARATYQALEQIDALGASFAASGLGDLAAVEGRFADAATRLRRGAERDLAAMNSDAAAAKLVGAAYAHLSAGRQAAAIEAADEALRHSRSVKIRFLAARTFVEAGASARALPLVQSLSSELYAEPQAHAKILEGVIALARGNARDAIARLREANTTFPTWIGFFDLGRAELTAGAYAQADSAFDVCLNARRGEALSLFVDEEPTYAYLPQAYYYQGLVREGLKSAGARESFRRYVAIRGTSTDDPLLAAARARAGE